VNQSSLPNCVVRSKLFFVLELCCPQRIRFIDEFVVQRISSLMNLCCSESVLLTSPGHQFCWRICDPVRWRVCIVGNQFIDEFVVQQISFADESMSPIISHKRVSFVYELHVTSESVSLPNFASLVKQFPCWFSAADSHIRNDVNACNDLIVWLCNIWNAWMSTCVFLENIWWWVMWLSNTNVLIVIIDVLGGATRISLSTGQGHPTRGISRWFPPPF